MRRHFHRCPNLRVLSVEGRQLSGDRGGGSVILEELCEAQKLSRCVGLVECEVLAPEQKRDLLVARVTRMRAEEGAPKALLGDREDVLAGGLGELRGELLEERAEIIEENRRFEFERTAAADWHGDASRGQREDLTASGVSARLDDDVRRLRASRLDAIDRALESMERGIFGRCAGCGKAIEIKRLRGAPDTQICGGCAKEALPVQ